MADVDNIKVMTQPEKIEYIINRGCEYFGLKRDFLTESPGTRNNIHRIKRYIALAIVNETETTMQDIALLLGFYDKNGVSISLKKINEELSDEFYGINKTKVVYNELLSYLNL